MTDVSGGFLPTAIWNSIPACFLALIQNTSGLSYGTIPALTAGHSTVLSTTTGDSVSDGHLRVGV